MKLLKSEISPSCIARYLSHDLWKIRLEDEGPGKSFLIRNLRIIILSLREFKKDKCILRASALTYYTLLSIVPVLAMAFGIAKGFRMEEALERTIRDAVSSMQDVNEGASLLDLDNNTFTSATVSLGEGSGTATSETLLLSSGENALTSDTLSLTDAEIALLKQDSALAGLDEVVDKVITFSNKMLDDANGGFVAGIGVLILLWTTIKVLGNIEGSFNDIWGIRKSRTWGRKFTDYLAFILVSPIVFIMANSMTMSVAGGVLEILDSSELASSVLWGWVDPLIRISLKALPIALISGLLTFTYIFIPNTKVKKSSALVGGIVAGILYTSIQMLYLFCQIGVAKYNAVYGSFAALPFFLVWIQISWLVAFFGAELSFAHQNVQTYEFEPDCLAVSPAFKKLITLSITHHYVKAFDRGERPSSAADIAQHLKCPIRLVNQILDELSSAHVLSEVKSQENRESFYQPARNIENMTVKSVLDQLDYSGVDTIPIAHTPELDALSAALESLRAAEIDSESNMKIKDL